jgi:hypothetical protein
MHRRSLVLIGMVLVLALPLSASQFLQLPFDQIAGESKYIVRGTIEQTWSAWDDAHEVIFTYASVRVSRYFGGTTGPDTLIVREVGGTVDGYTQEAIGFPMIRKGEDVVLMLAEWEDSPELRIHAYNQGKYLVRGRMGLEILVEDPVKQGDGRLGNEGDHGPRENLMGAGLRLEEFAQMAESARMGRAVEKQRQ